MANQSPDRDTYTRLLKELKGFRQQRRGQPSLDERNFFYSRLDGETVSSYYRLRRMLKESNISSMEIKSVIKKTPSHVWLLRKGTFETLMILGLLVVLFFYIKYIPIFKGYLPVYMCFSALSWFFLRRSIYNLNYKLSGVYHILIDSLEKELKKMKK